MGNTLKMDKQELLRRLIKADWSAHKIKRTTGIDRRTAAKYRQQWCSGTDSQKNLAQTESDAHARACSGREALQNVPVEGANKCPPSGVVHFEVPTDPREGVDQPSKSKAAVYDSQIKEKLKAGQNARSIYQDLYVEEGFRGSYDSVKRYLARIRKKDPKLYARIETAPGEEAQVDFGQGAPTLKNGRYVRPWLFVMTLSHSRKSFEKVVWQQDVETFIRCHEQAFESFGGAPRIVKLDNLKSGVLKAHLYEPELNPLYEAYSKQAGFIPLPCRVATPEHKGKVESNIDYVQDNALRGRRFSSLDEQNAYLNNWNRTWASTRIHGTTKRQVNAMYAQEQPSLQPLPEKPFAYFRIGSRKVSSLDSHVQVKGAYYPVPPRYMGKQVDVHFNSEWVKVLHQGKVIQWLSTTEKGRFHSDRSCLPRNKATDRNAWQQSLLQRCDRTGGDVRRWADQAISARGLLAYRSIQGVLSLLKKYPARDLNKACRLARERSSFSYHLIRNYLEEGILKQEDQQSGLRRQQLGDMIRTPQSYARLFEEVSS